MKSDFLKKIIAVTVIATSMGTFLPQSAAAVDFYAWSKMNGQSNGTWKQNGGNWSFYDYSGALQTGWIYDKGQWYYSDTNGVMQTGVIQVNGNIYLLSNTGAMQTGNAVINGYYYSFNENGVATGSNLPTPAKAYTISGEVTMPYASNSIVSSGSDDSSPSNPNTVARDPQNLVKYDVRFRDSDGDDLRTKSIEKGEKVTLYTPTKSGYKFVEWNTKSDGNGDGYDAVDKITVDKNISLYAQWEVAQDPSTPTTPTGKILVEEITVTCSSNAITTKAGTLQMSAKVLPVDASNNAVTWSVENGTGKATISDSGLLTASANGSVVVVATSKDGSYITGKFDVTISGQTDTGTTPGGTPGTTPGGTPTPTDTTVSIAPTVTTTTSAIKYDGTGTPGTVNSDLTFSYTLGTGTKAASGIESVNLLGTSWTLGNQYTINTDNKTIKINKSALDDYFNNVLKNKTPTTYPITVIFKPVTGTAILRPVENPMIHFISKPTAPSGIKLETDVNKIKALNNTMKLLQLEPNAQYEYAVVTTTGSAVSWDKSTVFVPTTSEMELTDAKFVVGNDLYIRKVAIVDGLGAENPPSDPQATIKIVVGNVARTKSSDKSITSFKLNEASNPSVDYVGEINEVTGSIKLAVPTVLSGGNPMVISTLTPKVEVSTSASVTPLPVSDNFTNPVKYTVTAEDGTTKDYTVTVMKTQLQVATMRKDNFTIPVSATTTAQVNINIYDDGYAKSGIGINTMTTIGRVTFTLPTMFTDSEKAALDIIRRATPYKDYSEVASVGIILDPKILNVKAAKVSSAETFDGLKTATAVSVSDSLQGRHLEEIPVATESLGSWSAVGVSEKTKYYKWMDANGNVLGYTSLIIKVQ